MENARTFTTRLAGLLAREHAALGEFLVQLAEFASRGLWAELGYSSLFDFLHRELRLSKGAAFYRKTAVDLVQRFPEIVEPLRDGRLCLMTVAEVARVLTPANRAQVLPRFFGLSKREAQVLAATLQPHPAPPQREVVTTVRAPAAEPALALTAPAADDVRATATAVTAVQPVEPAPSGCTAPDASRLPPAAASTTEPLTAELNRLHVTVSRRFLQKLEAARDALSHSHPNAGMDEILEAGLDLLLERHAKRKGLVKKPRSEPRPSSDPDHVPAHVRRAVWKRDGGRCQFRLASGEVCGSTVRVELDHVIPRCLGGPSTEENCRLACRVHNDRAARRVLGDAWMDQFTRSPRAGPARDAASRTPAAPARGGSVSPPSSRRRPGPVPAPPPSGNGA